MRPLREIFAVNLIALACDGDAMNYSPLARAVRGLSLGTILRIAAQYEGAQRD